MPAVHDGRNEDPPRCAIGPRQVGMDHHAVIVAQQVVRDQRPEGKAEQGEAAGIDQVGAEPVDRMKARERQPGHAGIAVMYGMGRPERPAVLQPMAPVGHEVAEKDRGKQHQSVGQRGPMRRRDKRQIPSGDPRRHCRVEQPQKRQDQQGVNHEEAEIDARFSERRPGRRQGLPALDHEGQEREGKRRPEQRAGSRDQVAPSRQEQFRREIIRHWPQASTARSPSSDQPRHSRENLNEW
jgi:hypothetical protein